MKWFSFLKTICHDIGNSLSSVGDDDPSFSTRVFNATPHVIGQEPLQVKNVKRPSLNSFDIFRQSFGAGIIHERLSVASRSTRTRCGRSARTSASRSIPTTPCPSRSRQSSSQPPTTTPATPDEPQKPHQRLLPHDDNLMCKRKKISINLDVHMLADSDNDNVSDLNARGRSTSCCF